MLYVVRHAEPDDSEARLTPRGLRQADALGRRLARVPLHRVLHGPLPRAAETARALCAHLPGVPVEASELGADRTPIPADDAWEAVPARLHPFLRAVPADERDVGPAHLADVVARLSAVPDGDEERHELLVTHNFVAGWIVRHVLDAPWWRWAGLNQHHCGLTVVQFRSAGPPLLLGFDDVGHLEPELRTGSPSASRA